MRIELVVALIEKTVDESQKPILQKQIKISTLIVQKYTTVPLEDSVIFKLL